MANKDGKQIMFSEQFSSIWEVFRHVLLIMQKLLTLLMCCLYARKKQDAVRSVPALLYL